MLFVIAFIIMFIPVVVFHPTKIIHKENIPKKGKKCIFTSNHYSNWDPPIYVGLLKRKLYIMAKKELFKNKLFGAVLKGLGAFPVDREQLTPSVFKRTMSELNKNHQVFIFPEGTRNKDGNKELLEIKSGVITFASKGECDIIPMLIYQKPRIFRKNYIIVGEPFKIVGENPKRLTKEETEENLQRYLEVMKNLRVELDSFVEKKKNKK